ncbi:GntR family transcriptional regulator, partial [Streptomyces sp. UNOB3_S3]|uniref:GntR family transcriptional regulator n=1 Tax=Streptomyces sp. UNOB3_S3 TaxID=2871682 RepID=UPI001E54B653
MALPKYDQIAADIRDRIVRGELTPGDALPSEAELTTRWSTARVTVARALDVLWEEGLIDPGEG